MGSIPEFESRDVTFIEENFPKQGEISQDLSLFEVLNQEEVTLISSGSIPVDEDVDMVQHMIHLHLLRMKLILFQMGIMIQVGAIQESIQMGMI